MARRVATRRRPRSVPTEPSRGALGCSCVTRTLQALKRYDVRPEQIDDIILQAINVSLCLESDGDASVAEGFNHDIVINGRAFGRH